MRKLETAHIRNHPETIRNEISRSEESEYDHQLQGVFLVSVGMRCYEAGRILGEDSRTMERWVRRFNEESFNALMEGKRSGRALKLTLSRLI
ncbi:MAG: hypothetical protein ACYDAP_01365 [Thermoplasmataceae archaeon]